MSPVLWQRLLATGANPERLRRLAMAAEASHGLDLSPAEQRRYDSADLVALERALHAGATIVPLPEAPGLPPAVFGWGNTACLDAPKVALVGTRGCSAYGKSITGTFASRLASSGCTMASGGAIGIDCCAHEGALEAGGSTVVVLPVGVDVAYPPRHLALYEKVRENGCLLSQFACGAAIRNEQLLARNELIAALCDALVLVEAPPESGALVTAGAAMRLGKPVFVVPGPVNQESFRGSHELIRRGALLLDDVSQVLNHLGVKPGKALSRPSAAGDDQLVLDVLTGLPQSPEIVSAASGLAIAEVLCSLTMLEIEGLVERSAEGYALKP